MGVSRDLRAGGLALLVDVVLPVVAYYLLRTAGADPVPALLLSGLPPALRVCTQLAREHTIDRLGLLVLVALALSAASATFSGDPRAFLVRNAMVGVPIAFWLLASARSRRPLTFEVGNSLFPSREREMEAAWRAEAGFRRAFRRLAVTWGIGGLLNSAASLAIALTLPVDAVPGLDTAIWAVATLALAAITAVSLQRAGAMRMVFAPTEPAVAARPA